MSKFSSTYSVLEKIVKGESVIENVTSQKTAKTRFNQMSKCLKYLPWAVSVLDKETMEYCFAGGQEYGVKEYGKPEYVLSLYNALCAANINRKNTNSFHYDIEFANSYPEHCPNGSEWTFDFVNGATYSIRPMQETQTKKKINETLVIEKCKEICKKIGTDHTTPFHGGYKYETMTTQDFERWLQNCEQILKSNEPMPAASEKQLMWVEKMTGFPKEVCAKLHKYQASEILDVMFNDSYPKETKDYIIGFYKGILAI